MLNVMEHQVTTKLWKAENLYEIQFIALRFVNIVYNA
jgi:hypothetical protein